MELRVAPGTLLLSVPQMLDPNFMHTVVLLCDHTDEGAYGLVINRPTPVTLDLLFPDHPSFSRAVFPVHSGGPVSPKVFQFVHRVPDRIPEGAEISEGLFIGGDAEALATYLLEESGAVHDVRVFLGYSGWSGGQLEYELSANSWVPAPPDTDLVFTDEPTEHTWRKAMRGLGKDGEGFANQPPDSSWN